MAQPFTGHLPGGRARGHRGAPDAVEQFGRAGADLLRDLVAYQYVQALPQVAQSQGSTVWVIPSEVTTALRTLSSAFGDSHEDPGAAREPVTSLPGRDGDPAGGNPDRDGKLGAGAPAKAA